VPQLAQKLCPLPNLEPQLVQYLFTLISSAVFIFCDNGNILYSIVWNGEYSQFLFTVCNFWLDDEPCSTLPVSIDFFDFNRLRFGPSGVVFWLIDVFVNDALKSFEELHPISYGFTSL
jgi:hypothetical protein